MQVTKLDTVLSCDALCTDRLEQLPRGMGVGVVGGGGGGVGNGCCLHTLEVACGISHTRVGAETTTRSGRTTVPEMLLDVVVVVGSATVMG